jgi:hypothetical protein
VNEHPLCAKPIVLQIICVDECSGLFRCGQAAPQRKKSGEDLDSQRKGLPGHVHPWLNGRDQLAPAIDALYVGCVVEGVARVPAQALNRFAERLGLLSQARSVWATIEQSSEFGCGVEVLIEEAVEQQISGREKRPTEGCGVVVIADGHIVSPDEQTSRALIAEYPRIVEANELVEVRSDPLGGCLLVGD